MNRMMVSLSACAVAAAACHKGGGDVEPAPPDNSPVVHSDISPKPPKGCGSPFWSVHYSDAYKTLREAEEYKPGLRDYYVRELSDRRNEYLLAGISPSFRKEWLGSHRTADKDFPCIVPLFDEIGAAAKRTLKNYRPLGYTHHESGEDDLIVAAVKEQLPDAEILASGVKQASWDIEKLNTGLPSLRYKYGVAWVKSAKLDDGFCRNVYVNIVQDYSGGGSYGDSKGVYISMEPAGCK